MRPRVEPSSPVGSALFALGFRPFFLLAGAFAATSIPLWLLAFFGKVTLPTRLHPAAWHAHEMVFGFAIAVIAGFLLTAVRNWTGQPTPSGARLGGLVLLWIAGRAAVLCSAWLPQALAVAIDVAFLPALAIAIGGPILRAKNARNAPLVGLVMLLAVANLVFHVSPAYASTAVRFALDVVLLIIFVIGGRVIPTFTANALKLETRTRLERPALASMAVLCALSPFAAASSIAAAVAAVAAIAAGALNVVRMSGWRSWETRRQPLLWVLHVSYAWLSLGLVLRGIAHFVPSWIATAPLHALAIGAVATMILGMMTRVSLGHTGRMLAVSSTVVATYVLLVIAAFARSLGPLVAPASYVWWLLIAGAAWALAFTIFTVGHFRILTSPRVDGKPG